jgi:spore germination cell wall hydrolase CwlJ-like protein
MINPAQAGVTEEHSAATSPASEQARQLRCLAEGIYFEARSEPISGKLAVGRVILNRVKSKAYPDTICDVVYQNRERRNRCQFSFACDGKPDTIKERAEWNEILLHAAWLMADGAKDGIPSKLQVSTHYHADYVSPGWSKRLTLAGQIGRHVFYYDPAV